MQITHHASTRQQQRGIPTLVVDLLINYGTVERAGADAASYYFDKASRRQVLAYAGPLSRAIEQYLDYYAIVGDDGHVITVAPRLKRIKH